MNLLSKFRLLIGGLLCLCAVNLLAATAKPIIKGAEPDLLARTLLISGTNFGSSSFSGTVFLFVPTLGETNLTVLGFDAARQELLVQLPALSTNFGGSFLLKVTLPSNNQSDPFVAAVGPFTWLDGTNRVTTPFNVGIGTLSPTGALHVVTTLPFTTNKTDTLVVAGGRVGIGTNAPQSTLHVNGTVTATAFSGSGSGITGLVATNLSGTINDAQLSANIPRRNADQSFSGANTFLNATNIFIGQHIGTGSSLSNLNASQLASGTVADLRLSSNVALVNQGRTYSGANLFTNEGNYFTGNGSSLYDLSASALVSGTLPYGVIPGDYVRQGTSFTGNGSGIVSLNASSLSTGTVPDARLSANVTLLGADQIFSGANAFTNASNSFVGSFVGEGSSLVNLNASAMVSGTLPYGVIPGDYVRQGTSFTGSGSGITGLDAGNLASGTVADARLSANVALLGANQTFGGVNSFTNPASSFAGSFAGNGSGLTGLSAGALSSGTVADARLSGNVVLQGASPVFNSVSVSGGTFSGNGSGLTALNAGNLASGTVADARLSANVALLGVNQTFGGVNSFTNPASSFAGSFAGNGSGLTGLSAGALSSGTVADARLSGNVVLQGASPVFNSVAVSGGAFSGNGSGLTGLNASALASGMISDSVMSTNVPFLNGYNLFTSGNFFVNTNSTFAGTFTGTFAGNGALLSNVPAATLTGTIPDAALPPNAATLNASQTFWGANYMGNLNNIFWGTYGGDGFQITNLNAIYLASGTMPDARLSANVPRLNATQTFSGVNQFTDSGNYFAGHGGGLYSISAGAIAGGKLNYNVIPDDYVRQFSSFVGLGSGIQGLNATNLASGTVPEARLSTNVALRNASQTFGGVNSFTNAANSFAGTFTGSGGALTGLWKQGGNSGTAAGTDYLGTADDQPLDLRANNKRGLRIQPHPFSPNLIGGSEYNAVGSNVWGAAIGGGGANAEINNVTGALGTIAGGSANVAGEMASVGGGYSNRATGTNSMIPGGIANLASGYASFAAGAGAQAQHQGAFVWSDGLGYVNSTGANQFVARASGGVTFYSSTSGAGVTLAPGSGAWSALSDRNSKENVKPVNSRQVLERLAEIPLGTWNYKSQEASIRHIGPMAQDFHAAFGVGEDAKRISTIDADGVALAAIQGLNEVVKEKDVRIQALEKDVAELKRLVEEIARRKIPGQ